MQVNPGLDENSVSSVIQIQMQVNPGLDENSVSSLRFTNSDASQLWIR